MTIEELVAQFPGEVRIGTRKPGHFSLVPDHFASHGEPPGPVAAEPIERLEAEGITLWRGGGGLAAADLAPAVVSAVYSASPGSPLAVPTGQVFAQLTKGLKAEDHAETFAGAGYEIAKTVIYAPHAAWLRARSGDVVESLRRISDLEAIAEVGSVEPQMLMARALR